MARFEARTSADAGRVIVALTGQCDLTVRDELTATLLAAVDGGRPVFVDLAGVDFMDSSGIHSLVAAHHAAKEAGSRVYLVNAAGGVAALLDLTGVAALLSPPNGGPGTSA